MAQKGLFVYAELDYRIHFEAIIGRYCALSAYVRSSFVRIICFRYKADFFVPSIITEGVNCPLDNCSAPTGTERRHGYGTDTSY